MWRVIYPMICLSSKRFYSCNYNCKMEFISYKSLWRCNYSCNYSYLQVKIRISIVKLRNTRILLFKLSCPTLEKMGLHYILLVRCIAAPLKLINFSVAPFWSKSGARVTSIAAVRIVLGPCLVGSTVLSTNMVQE